jgi:hypothetical protein
MTVKWSGPSGVIAPPIEGPITYELMAEDKSHSSRESSAIRQTSLASAPARGWRCWWRCDDPTLPAAWVLISGVFHRDGWVPDAIDPDASPSQVLARDYPGCVRGRAAPA